MNVILKKSLYKCDCLYFGLLVEVGSVLGKDLSDGHFILLGGQMEGGQTALHQEITDLLWVADSDILPIVNLKRLPSHVK